MGGEKIIRVNLPLLDEATSILANGERFQRDLSASEVGGVMQTVISSLLSQRENVQIEVPSLDVGIERMQGHLSGVAVIKKPVSASVQIDCLLGNSQRHGELALVDLEMKLLKGGIPVRALLGTLKNKAKERLKDPTMALFEVLKDQLAIRQVNLTGIGLAFQPENTLRILLTGRQQ